MKHFRQDLPNAWYVILFALLLATLLCGTWLLLLRYVAKTLVIDSIVLFFVVLAGGRWLDLNVPVHC